MDMASYDENGPLIPRGSVAFSARARNLPGDKHAFEAEIFMVSSEESTVIVEYNGMRLRDFGTRNDYYGFGTSPHTALADANPYIERLDGINADIMVLSRIKTRPCLIADDAPFYRGAQRVRYLPMSWSHSRDDIAETEEEFVVWQNGGPTGDVLSYYDRIKELVLSDAAPSRNGDLRSIIAGKCAMSVDDLLTPPTTC